MSNPNFFYDNVALPAAKTDRFPVVDPTKEWGATDANAVFTALEDARAVVPHTVNVKAFGAIGNGVANDAPAIQAAMNAAAVVRSDGTYGGVVFMPPGVYSVGTQLTGGNGVILRGAGTPTTILRCAAGFNAASMIRNLHQDGTQEFFSMEEFTADGNQGAGAVCSVAVVDLGSLFINSFFRNLEIVNGSNVGLHVAATNAMGPIYFENVWVANCIGHNVLCEESAGNVGACDGLCFVNLTSEHQGTGKSALYLKGLGSAAQWCFYNSHFEMGQGGGVTGQTGITIDGVSDVIFDGVQLLTGSVPAITAGIAITNVVQNVRIQMRAISNANLMPLMNDAKNSLTIGAVGSLPWYITPEVLVRGGLRFTPHTTAGSKSAVFQNSSGTDKAWFDDTGVLTGNSPTSAGADIGANTADGSTGRVLAMVNLARTRAFGYYFPDSSFFRFRAISAGFDVWDADNSGNFRTWNTTTFNANSGIAIFNTSAKGTGARAAAPSSGTHVVGEIVFNADPVATGFIGWVCITAGTPGTWKSWGVISP
jgi:hypothetical protein